MASLNEATALARRRELLVSRLDMQRGELVELIHGLREPVRTADRWWHLAVNVGALLPTLLLGGSVLGTVWALLARRRRGGPANRSWLDTALALWRVWRTVRTLLPALQAVVGQRNVPAARPLARYGTVEV